MSLKLKTLGMGLIAMLAMSAFAAMNAGAEGKGHFGAEVAHTIIKGSEGPGEAHRLHFLSHGLEGKIGCSQASYLGTAVNTKESTIEVAPTYSGCTTTGTATAVTVTPNGCKYVFKSNTGGTNGTASLNCAVGKAVEIHHPNCTITVPETETSKTVNQNLSGIHYTTTTESTKHALTIDVDVTFETTYHGGICVFLGTHPHFGELEGSVTVWGENTLGNRVHITAT